MRHSFLPAVLACLALVACDDADGRPEDATQDSATDDAPLVPRRFTVMTFNVGTTSWIFLEGYPDGYSAELADVQSSFFGNNLAWLPAAGDVAQLIETVKPDIVAFQELFHDPDCDKDCAAVADTRPDVFATACDSDAFPCRARLDDPATDITVRRVLGDGYAIACAPGHPDNCVGVRKDFGTLDGCEDGPCIDGLDGMPPPNGCTKGARVATAVVHVHHGPTITVVDVHTTAGTNIACREAQFRQVFEDRGDGEPAGFGEWNIVLGDMNIDPFNAEMATSDASARYWNEQVGEGKGFHYLSSSDASGPYTHPFTMTHLDHVISDKLTGSCEVLAPDGVSETDLPPHHWFFDHRPVFCTVGLP